MRLSRSAMAENGNAAPVFLMDEQPAYHLATAVEPFEDEEDVDVALDSLLPDPYVSFNPQLLVCCCCAENC